MALNVEAGQPFKICQLTDLHLGEYPLVEDDLKTLIGIKKILSENVFDLVMITGDVIWGKDNLEPQKSLQALYDVLNEFDVPVAITYGNHDTEGKFSRKYLRESENYLNNLAARQNSYVSDDHENYTLEVFQAGTNKLVNVIYIWDSGDYSKWPEVSLYAAINREQINWYAKTSDQYVEKTFDIGFLHIPLPEYKKIDREKIEGFFNKRICSPTINSGLFYELLEKNKVKAIFAGHDHDNNFSGEYAGVKLNYGNVTGYNSYGELDRGVLEIDLYNDKVIRQVIKF